MPEVVDTYFLLIDYIVFALMLIISSLIGVYFAFFAKVKQNTTTEYLMGGKTMGIFPISLSLIASYISGISLLGIPAEVYTYGTQFWVTVTTEALVAVTVAYIYLPVFYKLQLTSTYEYLNLRFNRVVRLLGSILFVTEMILYIPIVIYVPALAFSQVSGLNVHLVAPVVCIVCIFYTTLGGLKAVVWTDTIQAIMMFISLIIVIILGLVNIGGFEEVWRRNENGSRIDFFNFDLDPTIRHTFWTVSIGHYFSWLASCSINQAMVQRYMAMPSLINARISIFILAFGMILMCSMCFYIGLLIYAYYYNCDPITMGSVHKSDQLVPYFVMHIAGSLPGLPGLFVSGVFSAALSSMSTGLNSMTLVIFEDFVKPHIKTPMTESKASLLMKATVVMMGTICLALVFVVEKMGAIIQATLSLEAITGGALLGIFTLGMFFPQANAKGALIGGLVSGCLIGWISVGTQMNIAQGVIRFPRKLVSIDDCSSDWLAEYLNTTSNVKKIENQVENIFPLYRLSYMYYTLVGMMTAVSVGFAVSLLTGGNRDKQVHKDLLSPLVHKFLKKRKVTEENEKDDILNEHRIS